ncbi:MAG: glycosyltransferase, partial [Ignavibacteria bacterium]|nr:glycosyltransferase [Ignavibacteria bacterium]
MPEISVIIVTYNNEDEIESCVGSIPEFVNGSENELVIIDNNSQDKTYEILKALRFPYLKIIKNESNLGYTKAVNQGIRYS